MAKETRILIFITCLSPALNLLKTLSYLSLGYFCKEHKYQFKNKEKKKLSRFLYFCSSSVVPIKKNIFGI